MPTLTICDVCYETVHDKHAWEEAQIQLRDIHLALCTEHFEKFEGRLRDAVGFNLAARFKYEKIGT